MADPLYKRVTDFITQGGNPQKEGETKAVSPELEGFYKTTKGSYTRDPSKATSVVLDDKGNIIVNVPDKYADDEAIKKILNDSMLTNLSRNYKINKDVEYQSPIDETKKIKTQEYIDLIDQAAKEEIAVAEALPATQLWLTAGWGGSDEKNNVINSMTRKDIIVANTSATGKKVTDDSPLSVPKWLEEMYPQIKNLESYDNGFVKKGDFLNNFYNVSGKITEEEALKIALKARSAFDSIEEMDSDELARSIAFATFLSENDPNRSDWDDFWRYKVPEWSVAGLASITDTLFSSVAAVTNLAVDVLSLGYTRHEGMAIDPKENFISKQFQEDIKNRAEIAALIDKDGLNTLEASYVSNGFIASCAVVFLEVVTFGELGNALQNAIIAHGAENVGKVAAQEAALAQAGANATRIGKVAAGAKIAGSTKASLLSNLAAKLGTKKVGLFANVMNASGAAYATFMKSIGATQIALSSLSVSGLANVVNAAYKVTQMASLANTALGLASTLVLSATIRNADLTNKVMRAETTDSETWSWLGQVAFDAAKIEVTSAAMGWAYGQISNTEWFQAAKAKASKGAVKAKTLFADAYNKFEDWFQSAKTAAKTTRGKSVSNAQAASNEAVLESIIRNDIDKVWASKSVTRPAGEAVGRAAGEASGAKATASVVNGITGQMSEFESFKAVVADADNVFTRDLESVESSMLIQFNDPNAEPRISSGMTDYKKTLNELLDAEEKTGLLDKRTIKANKEFRNGSYDFEVMFANQSREVSIYESRAIDLQHLKDKYKALGVTFTGKEPEYVAAKNAYDNAASKLPDEVKALADRHIQILQSLESLIMNWGMDKGIVPSAVIQRIRDKGEWGENGEHWVHRVARKDVAEGVYTPNDSLTHVENIYKLHGDKIMEDDDILSLDVGFHSFIQDLARAYLDKQKAQVARNVDGMVIETTVPGDKSLAMDTVKRYRGEFKGSVKTGISSFREDIENSDAIIKKNELIRKYGLPSNVSKEMVVYVTGVDAIDITTLRIKLREVGMPTGDNVVDVITFDEYYRLSDPAAQRVLESTFGPTEAYMENGTKQSGPAYANFLAMQQTNRAEVDIVFEKVDRLNAAADKDLVNDIEIQRAGREADRDIKNYIDYDGEIVSDYQAPKGSEGLKQRERIADIDAELKSLDANAEAYRNGLSWQKNSANLKPDAGVRVDEYGVKVKSVPINGKPVEIDVEIADRISAINNDGYVSYNSCSGIGADHEDKADAGNGYIQFSGKLDDAKENAIKEAAKKAGMGVEEEVNLFYGPTLTIRQANTADQAFRYEEVVREANRRTQEHFNVPKELRGGSDWIGWVIDNEAKLGEDALDWREAEIKKVYKEHGGYAQPNDKARKKSWDIFFNELGYGKNNNNSLSSEAEARIKEFADMHIKAGKVAAKNMKYKGAPNDFEDWYKTKKAKLNAERTKLANEVEKLRGKERPQIEFKNSFYSDNDVPKEYISNRRARQEISDKALGVWNGLNGGLAYEWLNNGDLTVKQQLRDAIEKDPELRSALLSTMYDNSGSDLPYEQWLETPIALKRQQTVDSLRKEDAFLSFSMQENWEGVGGLIPRLETQPGDIVTLVVKPRDTLGEIPKGVEAEDELEVIVPREVYATAMTSAYATPPEAKPKAQRGKTTSTNKKYDIDIQQFEADIDNAVDGMIDLIAENENVQLYVESLCDAKGYKNSALRLEFEVLSEMFNKNNAHDLNVALSSTAKTIVKRNVNPKELVIAGNLETLEGKIKAKIYKRLLQRLSDDKTALESAGEAVDSESIDAMLKEWDAEIMGYKSDDTYITTTDGSGNVEILKVTPAFGKYYNNKTVFKPTSTARKVLQTLAVAKRISLTNTNPRSLSKQTASDTAMSWATVGSIPIPGIYGFTSKEIAAQFGEQIAAQMAQLDPYRFQNVLDIAERDGISLGEAAIKNMNAISESELPFTTMSREALKQGRVSKYGVAEAINRTSKTILDRIHGRLVKVSEVLGKPNDIREMYTRKAAGVKAQMDALKEGYNYQQAEALRMHAINNATTNFRRKSILFNNLRDTTPYLVAGVSGAKSFWRMFEFDPIGVSARIFNGVVVPYIFLMGEIQDDETLRKKYQALAESEKKDHIIVNVGGELVRIPVGEEIGTILEPFRHLVEWAYGESKYTFWSLMANDVVGFFPVDLTGFTDLDMWYNISDTPPTFMEVMENGASKIFAQAAPPIIQSGYMAATNRDPYTGKKISSSRITIDNDGNAVIMSNSQSEFAQALSKIVGGDARVIEKVTSGIVGTTALHALDTLTSAVQFVATGGKEGSLTTAVTKAAEDIQKPYAIYGYADLDRQWSQAVSELFDKKKSIENSDVYKKYNEDISKEKDAKKRQNLISKRNDLLTDYQRQVEKLLVGYRSKGGQLDGYKFSTATSLLVFEDALRADRTFMHLNTEYLDARAQALETLNSFGITNPEGVSMLGYIYFDDDGNEQLKMWNPAQMQIISNWYYEQGDIHTAHLKAIIDDGTDDSLKNLGKAESDAEEVYWNKAKMTDDDYDAIDALRKEYNTKVILAIQNYINSYGAANVLGNETVMDYLENVIKVPTSYEKVNGRFVSSGNGKLNKQQGFARSYIKMLFGV